MVLKKISQLLLASLFCISLTAQNEVVHGKTFYDTRIVNGHSVETNNKGVLKFIISHRFGEINGGPSELWGLDNSTIRFGLDYGITHKWTIGVGRSSFEKTYDAYLKAKLIEQKDGGAPITLVGMSNVAINTLPFQDPDAANFFSNRLFYTHQILLARRFNDRFSLQLMPSIVHRNLVEESIENNDVYAIGTAARYVVSKRLTINVEYYYTLPDQLRPEFTNSLAIGVDIETKGHVFQLTLSNSRGMIEKFFISETRGKWGDGDIHLGFNISRDFKIKGRKYQQF